MKAVLRAAALLLATIIGLWSLGHGIAIAVGMRMMPGEHTDIFRHIVEGSIAIAGGICVLSLAAQQFYCWRTHRKDGGLL